MRRILSAATLLSLVAGLNLILTAPAAAQTKNSKSAGADEAAGGDPYMVPTEAGIRFTPAMAKGIGRLITREMKKRYELTDEQAEKVQDIYAHQMMRLAHDTQFQGRDLIEKVYEVMVNFDGPPDQEQMVSLSQDFIKDLKPMLPDVERFINETIQEVGRQIPLKHRMQYATETGAIITGFNLAKSEMEKIERGESDLESMMGNIFGQRRRNRNRNRASSQPDQITPDDKAISDEQMAQYKSLAESNVAVRIDSAFTTWERYVNNAIAYYELDETKASAARSILEDCTRRAETVMTPERREKARKNRLAYMVAQSLSNENFANGPLEFRLATEYDEIMRPISDIETELKKRIDTLPTSAQRAAALKRVRASMSDVGVEMPG